MTTLETLPGEIFLLILDQLHDKADLKRLCRVSKKLDRLTLPTLFETLVIRSPEEYLLERTSIQDFIHSRSISRDCLRYVRNLQFRAPIHQNLSHRCIHYKDSEIMSDEQVYHQTDFWGVDRMKELDFQLFKLLSSDVETLLGLMKNHTLRSFSWELGTCVPREILGSNGYLARNQKSIESIKIVNGMECNPTGGDTSESTSIAPFNSLRRLSWIGLLLQENSPRLNSALRKHSKCLTHLELDCVEYQDEIVDREDPPEYNFDNYFASEVLWLEMPPTKFSCILTALTSLSLGSISFANAEKPLLDALNTSKLLHLKLSNCPAMDTFVEEIANSCEKLALLSLEYSCDMNQNLPRSCQSLRKIVERSPNLKDLFLQLPDPRLRASLWYSILNIPNLERLVFHTRKYYRPIDLSPSRRVIDQTYLIPDPETWDLDVAVGGPFLPQLRVSCCGLSFDLNDLDHVLPYPASKSFNLLHIRKSGLDLLRDIMDRIWDDEKPELVEKAAKLHFAATEESCLRDAATTIGVCDDDYKIYLKKQVPTVVLRFANRAFGKPDRLPRLQLLAYGDFSHDNRFGLRSIVFCRNAHNSPGAGNAPFRPVRESDLAMNELINENIDFLAACPTEPVVRW